VKEVLMESTDKKLHRFGIISDIRILGIQGKAMKGYE
jgi:hypothetical protein